MRPLGLFFASMFSMLAFTVPAQAAPVCGNSVVESGEDCDDGNTDPGDCCSPTCQYESGATECRASAGICDVGEICDGVSDDCPPDLFLPYGILCRHPAHVCDWWRVCGGGGPDDCSTALFPPPDTVCRDSTGPCDPEEFCDWGYCPADVVEPPTTECRGAAGICDAVDYCDGASADCPPDEKLTTVCRPAAHICDAAEFCDGVSDDCPITDLPANGLACPDGDLCNGDEICVGWVCMPGVPLVCDDEDICTADGCDQFLGCVYEPTYCNGHELPSASPAGRLLLSLLVVGAGATFLAWRRRFRA